MIRTTKTKRGWVVETTNMRQGMLESGGRSERKVLYARETLDGLGVNYEDDPSSPWNEEYDIQTMLAHGVEPDRVLRHGHEIQ